MKNNFQPRTKLARQQIRGQRNREKEGKILPDTQTHGFSSESPKTWKKEKIEQTTMWMM